MTEIQEALNGVCQTEDKDLFDESWEKLISLLTEDEEPLPDKYNLPKMRSQISYTDSSGRLWMLMQQTITLDNGKIQVREYSPEGKTARTFWSGGVVTAGR
jgi:hypothetical protein